MNRLFLYLLCWTLSLPLLAQDYEMTLEGISKVIISAETTIILKTHERNSFLIKEFENVRDIHQGQANGLRRLSNRGSANTAYGLEIQKSGALLIVKGLRERREANLVIHLPKDINISVESLANNEIYIDGFHAEIEAINHLGTIVLTDVTGPIVAENDNGNVRVVFGVLDQSYPISLLTSNGDIDVRMPATSNATLRAKTLRGDFYTDFDVVPEYESDTNNRLIRGNINGGGVKMNLQNLKGDIYLRKRK
ncbi:MAG: DUF4097 family beta strand repeat-containing protein [Bacteroidota bacterium]